MSILIKNARIVSPGSKLNGTQKDILIKNGRIEKISNKISDKSAKMISSENLYVSPGWMDIGTCGAEPGFEFRETFSSLSKSAASGGFTSIAVFPNTNPPVDNKSSVQFIQNNTRDEVVDFYPIGAISKNCKGEEITEMIDMATHGAIAFSDGKKSLQSNGVLLRALQYAKSTGRIIINHPDDHSLSNGNNIHEGEISTSLGLKASPSLSEILTTERDILMAEYAESMILLHNLSCKESVDKLLKLKSSFVASSVSYLNLCKTDDSLADFNVNYKTNPPLRSAKDRKALIKGINQGAIN
ncbi:MAG: dihydroorotase, partial [Bacteroidia bacterium]|nr:dihydroorotase [Bacteroidia bacterium]